MGTKVSAPQPSAEEQRLTGLQADLAERQAEQQQALEPFQLQAAGLVKEPDGTLRRQTEEERVAGQTDLQRQQESVQAGFLQRQQDALAGRLEVNPALEAALKRRESLIEEQISRSGQREGTLGARTRGIFQESAELQREMSRRGDIAGLTGSSLGFAQLGGQQAGQQFGQLQGVGGAAQGTIGLLGTAAQPFQRQTMMDFQARQQSAANKAGLIGAGFQAVGTGIGLGFRR
jgi:hypothetical protein